MSGEEQESDAADEDRPVHLEDLPDECGCTEVRDHLSEQRERSEE